MKKENFVPALCSELSASSTLTALPAAAAARDIACLQGCAHMRSSTRTPSASLRFAWRMDGRIPGAPHAAAFHCLSHPHLCLSPTSLLLLPEGCLAACTLHTCLCLLPLPFLLLPHLSVQRHGVRRPVCAMPFTEDRQTTAISVSVLCACLQLCNFRQKNIACKTSHRHEHAGLV